MANEIKAKQLNSKDLQVNGQKVTGMPKVSVNSDNKLATGLSGNSNIKFGSLSLKDSDTLTSSLSGKSGAVTTKAGETTSTTSTAVTENTSDTSLFTYNEQLNIKSNVKTLGNDITNTKSSIFSGEKTGATSSSSDSVELSCSDSSASVLIGNAKTSMATARGYASQAEAYAAKGDWKSCLQYYEKARLAVAEAQYQINEARAKGANSRETNDLYAEAATLKRTYEQNYNSAGNKYSSVCLKSQIASCTDTSSCTTGFWSNLWSSVKDGSLNKMLGNVSSLAGGGQSTGGASGSGRTTGAGGTTTNKTQQKGGSSPATVSGSGKATSPLTAKLKYDSEYKDAVAKSGAETQFNDAAREELLAKAKISEQEDIVKQCDKESDALDDEIDKVNGESETYLEEYKKAKEEETEATKNYNEQKQIADQQGQLATQYNTKLTELNNQTQSKKGAVSKADTADKAADADIVKAKDNVAKAEAMHETTPGEKAAKQTAIAKAQAELIKAETHKKETEQALKNAQAELERHEKDIKEYEKKYKEADEKAKTAQGKLEDLKTKKEAATKKAKQAGEKFNGIQGKVSELKNKIDALYAKKTQAESVIAEQAATRDCASSKKDLAQELADNAVDEAKAKKSQGFGEWVKSQF